MSSSRRLDTMVVILFDTIANNECRTRYDIIDYSQGGFRDIPAVDEVLGYIRNPDIAAQFGWTVPHVRRGRPRDEQSYRYLIAGLNGQPLSVEDIGLVQEGTLSTVRQIATECRNQANTLRMTMVTNRDKKYQDWAEDTAKVLEGVHVQARREAKRLARMLGLP